MSGELALRVPITDDVLCRRKLVSPGGQNGRNCGQVGLRHFLLETSLPHLRQLVAETAETHAEYVLGVVGKTGLYVRKRRRDGQGLTVMDVANYMGADVRATNLFMALAAKAIDKDIYIVTSDGVGSFLVTLMAKDAALNDSTKIGSAVQTEEALARFGEYVGPVLAISGRGGHWYAFPLGSGGEKLHKCASSRRLRSETRALRSGD